MPIRQTANVKGKNIKVTVNSDYPSFDVVVNGNNVGRLYNERNTQSDKTISNGFKSFRSDRIIREVQNSDPLQRAITYHLYNEN